MYKLIAIRTIPLIAITALDRAANLKKAFKQLTDYRFDLTEGLKEIYTALFSGASEDSLHAELASHFGVKPGISKDYVAAIMKNVDQKELQKLKDENIKADKALRKAKKHGNAEGILAAGAKLQITVQKYMRFLVDNNVPFIIEVVAEVGMDAELKTMSGGLGVLSGDKHKAMTDLGIPVITFSVLSEVGYGDQHVDTTQTNRSQKYGFSRWNINDNPKLARLDYSGKVPTPPSINFFPGTTDTVLYSHAYVGKSGAANPVLFVSTAQTPQSDEQHSITKSLYNSEPTRKLASQYVLAHTVVDYLEKTGINAAIINMNEGHAALVPIIMLRKWLIAELEKKGGSVDFSNKDTINSLVKEHGPLIIEGVEQVRRKLTFVTHTIDLPAFDKYDEGNLKHVLSPEDLHVLYALAHTDLKGHVHFDAWGHQADATNPNPSYYQLSMAKLGAYFATVVNGVAEIHTEITKARIFPHWKDKTGNATNAVHVFTWWGKATQLLEDLKPVIGDLGEKYFDASKLLLLKGERTFREAIKGYHLAEKAEMVGFINKLVAEQFSIQDLIKTPVDLKNTMVAVFARRAAVYKMNDLLVDRSVMDMYAKLAQNLKDGQRIVLIVAGKAHPDDKGAQQITQNILNEQRSIFERTNGKVILVFKENYNMDDGKMFANADLNMANPVVGWEASGTSPMKNPLRLVMHTFDGFFAEYHRVAKDEFEIEKPSFGFGPTEASLTKELPRDVRDNYAKAFAATFAEATDMFFKREDEWIDKQIEQLAVFNAMFRMERFAENYLTLWRNHVKAFDALFDQGESK